MRAAKSKGSGDGGSAAAKIALISAVIAALIGGTATVVAALINESKQTPANSPPVAAGQQTEAAEMPLPTCDTCTSGKTFPEQVGAGGAATFRNPRAFRGNGARVSPLQRVEVVCRFYDPNAPPSVQPGWWYLLAEPPWNRQYYSPANSYLNGDLPEGPALTSVDSGVPVC